MVERLNITGGECEMHPGSHSGLMYHLDLVNFKKNSISRVWICERCAQTEAFFFVDNNDNVRFNKNRAVYNSTIETCV